MTFQGSGEFKLGGKTYDVEIKVTEKSSKGFGINPDTIKILLELFSALKSGDHSSNEKKKTLNRSDIMDKARMLLNIMKQSTNDGIRTTARTIHDSIFHISRNMK